MILCGSMHQSFTDALVVFDNFRMFADSFRLVSIHIRCPRIRCKLSVSRIARWFPAGLLVAGLTIVPDRRTDRRTDRLRYSVCNNKPHTAMRPNNANNIHRRERGMTSGVK